MDASDDGDGEPDGAGKSRMELFSDLKIPELLEVKLPAVVTKPGHVQEEITTKMLATPKKSASVWTGATGPNLTWFKHACTRLGQQNLANSVGSMRHWSILTFTGQIVSP